MLWPKPQKDGRTTVDGKDAFVLYDTYGFPLDLTELILRENNPELDHEGFEAEMKKQKERARNAAAMETGDWTIVSEGEQEFVGYDLTETRTRILRYRKIKQKNKEFYRIILSKSPFYAEMGGQVGDRGSLTDSDGNTIEIFDTKRENNIGVHLSSKLPEKIEGALTAKIDVEARKATSANHSATHLLHEALREVLGSHVEQKGSFVSPGHVCVLTSRISQKCRLKNCERWSILSTPAYARPRLLDEHRELPIARAREMGATALSERNMATKSA